MTPAPLLSAALAALLASPACAQINGAATSEEVDQKAYDYYKNMGGVDPMEKWKEFVEESITPDEVGELMEYKEQMDAAMKTAEQISRGEINEVVLETLRGQYEELLKNKKIPRKLRRELPRLGLIDQLVTTVNFAIDMKKTAMANEVATQAEEVFQVLCRDRELSGADDPFPANVETAQRVYKKYWKSGLGSKMDAILRHQRLLSMDEASSEPATFEANVVDGLVGLLKMTADYKKAYLEKDKAQYEAKELMSAYGRWGKVTGNDFGALMSLLGTEKQVEAKIPSYEKMLAEAPAAIAAARVAMKKGDLGPADVFCDNTAGALYSAKIGLRDFGGRTQKVRMRTAPLLEKITSAQADASKFCREYAAAYKQREEEERLKLEKEYEQYKASIKSACGEGGISGMAYAGPKQAELDSLAVEVDKVYQKDGLAVQEPQVYWTPLDNLDADCGPDAFKDEPKGSQTPGSLMGIVARAFGLARSYCSELDKYRSGLSKAREAIINASAKQRDACEASRKAAADADQPSPDCLWCDTGPADRAFSRKFSQSPRLKFSVVGDRINRWRRVVEAGRSVAEKAEMGFFEDASRLAKRISELGVGVEEMPVSAELVEGWANGAYAELKGSQDLNFSVQALRRWAELLGERSRYQSELLPRARKSLAQGLSQYTREFSEISQELDRLSGEAGTAAQNYQAVASFYAQTPWPEQGEPFRAKAAEVPERTRSLQDMLARARKGPDGAKKALADGERGVSDLDWYARSFSITAAKLEKLEKSLDEDADLRALRTRVSNGSGGVYMRGMDRARLSALQGKLSAALGSMGQPERRAAPGAIAELQAVLAAAQKIKPVPSDAILLDDGNTQTLLEAGVYRDLEAKVKKIDPTDASAPGEAIKIRAEIEGVRYFQDYDKKEYANHPVYKAYLSALAACEGLDKKAAGAKSALVGRIKSDKAAIEREMKAISAKPASATPAALDALEKRIKALVKDWLEKLNGQERDESGIGDLQQLEVDLAKLRETTAEARQDQEQETARKALQALEAKMEAASPSQMQALMSQASVIANKARIGGEPETQELMGRLADLAREKGAAQSGPPSGASVQPEDGEDSKALRDALDDFRELNRELEALPGGPDSQSRADDLVERGQALAERALEKMPKDASGRPNPNRKPVEDELERLRKAAELKKTAKAAAASHAKGVGPQAVEAIRALYQKFAAAFASKDLAGVLDCLAEDWESSEGIGLGDMEKTLGNSFQAFDTVKMEILNLQIRSAGQGLYQAAYSTLMTGLIRQNDIKHEEKSTHSDTIVLTPEGPRIKRTSGSTAWVQ